MRAEPGGVAPLVVRAGEAEDAKDIAHIYNHFVRNTAITFEEGEVAAALMAERMAEVQAQGLPWLVASRLGRVVGYAYGTRWKARSAYRFTVETTVYVDAEHGREGIGGALYAALFSRLRERDFHAAIACIALPNPASVALHEGLGMKKVGHFAEVGFKFDQWRDVGYWQMLF